MAEIKVVDGKIYFEGHLVARISAEAPPSVVDRFEKLQMTVDHINSLCAEYDMKVGDIIELIEGRERMNHLNGDLQ